MLINMKYDRPVSYCITEIKFQSGAVRCLVAHRSYSKYTFKMTFAGRKGAENQGKWPCAK